MRRQFTPDAWYAVYTRSRQEQAVGRYLARPGVEVYVPTQQQWSRRLDRRKLIEVPALPGYLFVRCDLTPELRAEIKKAPGVVSIIVSNGRPARIPDDQVASLRILLGSGREVTATAALAEGERVQIAAGPLKGVVGLLERVDAGQRRLVVRIDHVGLSVAVSIHAGDVERA
jgi:transcription antitermination factor NusG